MKIKSLLTCMMVSLVTILPLQAHVGKEMKAFRNKDGITVTMLNPSLYSRYKQGDLLSLIHIFVNQQLGATDAVIRQLVN